MCVDMRLLHAVSSDINAQLTFKCLYIKRIASDYETNIIRFLDALRHTSLFICRL